MNFQDDELREFSKLWKQEFGETISLDEAKHEASLLLELYGLLSQPLPQERSDRSEPNPSST